MLMSRRAIVVRGGTAIAAGSAIVPKARADGIDLTELRLVFHEQAMRAAIRVGRSAFYPFGAVVVRPPYDELVAEGANNSRVNPTFHGEMVCINDYVARYGNQGWENGILYTT